MRKKTRKLALSRETIRSLSQLKIAGGGPFSVDYCPPTYTECSNRCPAEDTDQCGNTVTCTYTIDIYSRYNIGCL